MQCLVILFHLQLYVFSIRTPTTSYLICNIEENNFFHKPIT